MPGQDNYVPSYSALCPLHDGLHVDHFAERLTCALHVKFHALLKYQKRIIERMKLCAIRVPITTMFFSGKGYNTISIHMGPYAQTEQLL